MKTGDIEDIISRVTRDTRIQGGMVQSKIRGYMVQRHRGQCHKGTIRVQGDREIRLQGYQVTRSARVRY